MIEPVALQDFFAAFFSGAMVILSGALYALLFAFSRVHRRPRLMLLAYLSYAVLVGSVLVLARVMHFSGLWTVLVMALILGYLLAPHGIWHLSVATHGAGGEHNEAESNRGE